LRNDQQLELVGRATVVGDRAHGCQRSINLRTSGETKLRK
jgi:hypothetical protein